MLTFDNSLPDMSGGMHFNIYNNLWGTAFPQWYSDDAQFRFKVTLCTNNCEAPWGVKNWMQPTLEYSATDQNHANAGLLQEVLARMNCWFAQLVVLRACRGGRDTSKAGKCKSVKVGCSSQTSEPVSCVGGPSHSFHIADLSCTQQGTIISDVAYQPYWAIGRSTIGYLTAWSQTRAATSEAFEERGFICREYSASC